MAHPLKIVSLLLLLAIEAFAAKPNVVLIVCDDLNDYNSVLKGHVQAKTPHLDSLAKESVTFNRAYSNNPVCAPSSASFLTGIHCYDSGNMFWRKW
jgi:arylsulfatase A-like enzyme